MGYKSRRIRQHFLCLITVASLVICLTLQSCLPGEKFRANKMAHERQLAQNRFALERGFFDTVILQGKRILQNDETKPPADIALYTLGEAYAHHAFEGKDYGLSKYYFEKLVENFPDSHLAWEAKTFISLYENFSVVNSEPAPFDEEQDPFSWTMKAHDSERFDKAIARNKSILDKSGKTPPADSALYNLGLIFAHIDNPAKDFQKARAYFEELILKFPGSSLAEEARIWIGLFQIIEKMQQIDIDIEKQKKKLSR